MQVGRENTLMVFDIRFGRFVPVFDGQPFGERAAASVVHNITNE